MLGLLLLTLNPLWAQQDPEAMALLEQVATKATTAKALTAKFNYTIGTDDKNQKLDGSFSIKGSKFKMEIDETIVFSNGKTRWVYLKESNEVNVSNVEKNENLEPEERFLSDPISLYTVYKSGFKVIGHGSEVLEGKNCSVVDLTPEAINKPYFKIRIWIDANHNLFAVKYFQKNGERLVLTLTNVSYDSNLKEADFEFNTKQYPGVEVIDLR